MATDSDHTFDVIVIGLGPGGEHVAGSLAERGLRVLGVDDRLVGGECPYWGCIPSKMMIRAADALAEARRVDGLAGSVGERHARLVGRRQAHPRGGHRQLGRPGRRRPAHRQGRDLRPRPRPHRRARDASTSTAPPTPRRRASSSTRARRLRCRRSRASRDTPYWTNHEVIEAAELPASIIVLGGGAIGCELSQVMARFGVEVTVVEAADRLLALEEPEASAALASGLRGRRHHGAPGRRRREGQPTTGPASPSRSPTARR